MKIVLAIMAKMAKPIFIALLVIVSLSSFGWVEGKKPTRDPMTDRAIARLFRDSRERQESKLIGKNRTTLKINTSLFLFIILLFNVKNSCHLGFSNLDVVAMLE